MNGKPRRSLEELKVGDIVVMNWTSHYGARKENRKGPDMRPAIVLISDDKPPFYTVFIQCSSEPPYQGDVIVEAECFQVPTCARIMRYQTSKGASRYRKIGELSQEYMDKLWQAWVESLDKR